MTVVDVEFVRQPFAVLVDDEGVAAVIVARLFLMFAMELLIIELDVILGAAIDEIGDVAEVGDEMALIALLCVVIDLIGVDVVIKLVAFLCICVAWVGVAHSEPTGSLVFVIARALLTT